MSLIILISYLFSTSNPDIEKTSAYKCGFDPYEDARNFFDVKFYLMAIIFASTAVFGRLGTVIKKDYIKDVS